MKSITKLKWLVALFIISVNAQSLSAQSKADIFDKNVPVTWLGVDYTLVKFIGTPSNVSKSFNAWTAVKVVDNGVVTKEEFVNDFTVEWNQLFIDEAKKYNVAKAIDRSEVNYAIDVCINANKALIKKDFFSNNQSDFHLTTEATIADAVKNYDFQKNQGLGMMFFVDGMNKGTTEEGLWVTFVDMKSKTVLLTKYATFKCQGSGFRNYWAKALWAIPKEMDFKKWK